ncbi:MAG: hypothetical protein V4472_25665 [Pseudomonadota bacterium]
MNRTDLPRVMGLISTYWPSWKMPTEGAEADAFVDAWGRLLLDLPSSAVLAAVESYATDGERFAPGPGELRRRAIELGAPNRVPDADEAWSEVCEAITKHGWTVGMADWSAPPDENGQQPTKTVAWSHPAIESTVEALGWHYLCTSEDAMADRAHFMRFYGAARQRIERERTMPESVRALTTGVVRQLEPGE